MNRPRFDAYSKVILTIIAACMVGLCVDRFTARADAQATQPTTTQPTTVRYDRVEAKTFILVDDEGKERGAMRVLRNGAVSLVFADQKGKVRAGLGLEKEGGPCLVLSDGNLVRATLGVVDLRGAKPGATGKTAPSSLVLYDKEGKVIWQAPPD